MWEQEPMPAEQKPSRRSPSRRSRDTTESRKGAAMAGRTVASKSSAVKTVRGLPLRNDELVAVHKKMSKAVKNPELRRLMRELERETAEREEESE